MRDNIQGSAGKGAGGVYIDGGATMRRCRILRNYAGDVGRGNGVYINSGTVQDCSVCWKLVKA